MLKQIQNALENAPFDAVLLTSAQNRRYATGFPSSAGVCFITRSSAYFFTDFRYIEEARRQAEGFEVGESSSKVSYSALVNDCIQPCHVQKIALEEDSLTYSAFMRWQKNLQSETVPMGSLMNRLRLAKTVEEIRRIVSAQRIAERAFAETLNDIRPGVTEKQIAARLTYLMLTYGAENMSFDPIVVSGENSSKPHGVPTEKPIAQGEFVTMDFGCICDGYCSDMTRTVAVGHCTEEMRHVYQTVLSAQLAGIAAARAGVPGSVVDSAGRAVIEQAGYGDAFGHGFGHGVGLDIHEEPSVSQGGKDAMPAGAVITAEPGIYLPGKFGVRIEDMLCLEEGGCRNLTLAPKELLILE